jgi:hypothetical protein
MEQRFAKSLSAAMVRGQLSMGRYHIGNPMMRRESGGNHPGIVVKTVDMHHIVGIYL